MAVITEMQEEAVQQRATTSTGREVAADSSAAYAQAIAKVDEVLKPILLSRGSSGLLEVVVDFLRRQSDAFKSESTYSELVAVLSAAKEKEDSASLSAAKEEERAKVSSVPASAPAPEEASLSAKKHTVVGEGKREGKATEDQVADANTTDLRGICRILDPLTYNLPLHMCISIYFLLFIIDSVNLARRVLAFIFLFSLFLYIYVYIYIYIHTYMYTSSFLGLYTHHLWQYRRVKLRLLVWIIAD